MAASPSQSHPPVWYIQASGRVWGPYPHARMADFVSEGRLSPGSLVGVQPGGPFSAAERRRELIDLFAPAMPGADPLAARPEVRAEPKVEPRVEALRPELQASQARPVAQAPLERLVAEAEPAAEPSPQPAPSASMVPARAIVVWADLASLTPDRFEAVLGAYGPCAAIRPGLWLVQARMSPSALRNALSRHLRTEDALLVLQAPLEQVAWFNLAPSADRDLRHLWGNHGA